MLVWVWRRPSLYIITSIRLLHPQGLVVRSPPLLRLYSQITKTILCYNALSSAKLLYEWTVLFVTRWIFAVLLSAGVHSHNQTLKVLINLVKRKLLSLSHPHLSKPIWLSFFIQWLIWLGLWTAVFSIYFN